ncbi:hypothetical protein J4Q44_G00093110 [Coregonus suidteri]|uniref:Uncharacterized protein n=1 Tax=Coregonus suidteri TaxID=861788 RepID=A0AAN8M177_9TELE
MQTPRLVSFCRSAHGPIPWESSGLRCEGSLLVWRIPRLYSYKGSEPGCSAGDEKDRELNISDEARLLKQRVLRQIPQQQRMILGQSYTSVITQRIPRRGEIAMRSHNSSCSVHTSHYSPTTKYVVTVEPIQKDTTLIMNNA